MFEIVGKYNKAKVYADIVEAPQAYKPIESILENIKDNADVVTRIRPIYNFKASE